MRIRFSSDLFHRGCFCFFAALFLSFIPLSAEVTRFEVIKQENVMVPMRDGVKLATDIYLPGKDGKVAEGKFPVLLSRTPYGKGSDAAKTYTPDGYVVIMQDTRGRGESEGTWTWMIDDREDGYDAIEWIAAQPWSNGKVGMMGCSYVGATQHLAAMTKPPHLTTLIPSNPSINHGVGGIIYGGAFRLRIVNWMLNNAAKGSERARDPAFREALERQAKNSPYYLNHLPLRRGMTPLRMVPEYEDMLVEMLAHRRNDEFWRFSNVVDHVDEHKDLPVFMVGGWYDLFSTSTTETYMALKRVSKSPVHLIMGPWPHCSNRSSHAQVDFGPDASADMRGIQRAWFDRWLKGDVGKFGTEAPFRTPVRAFVMGTGNGSKTEDGKLSHGGFWRDLEDYPPPQAKATKFYLHPGGDLATTPPAKDRGATTFEFDPNNPVPTIGGGTVGGISGAWNQWGGSHIWNAPDAMPLSMRNDVVVFQTPPLERDTEVIGPVEVKLWASSSAVDTDFTAKLIDVYPSSADFPEGFDLIMGDGIIRARYRDSDKEENLMTPGEIYEFTIKLDPCSNVFKKGNRIRVDISSSNFPRFDVNPNSGEPANDYRRMITAINTIHHDSVHPSHIVLPLMPVEATSDSR
ncbi:MAG: CocE/NonD family hydrolase [Verrucomicrobiae bacterium]|nr:CocE/NonD family hydrolase [Verrucomicrobiae bacterium]